jgi:hypothetical protein
MRTSVKCAAALYVSQLGFGLAMEQYTGFSHESGLLPISRTMKSSASPQPLLARPID